MSQLGHLRWLSVSMTTSDLTRQADQFDARPDFAFGPTGDIRNEAANSVVLF